MLGVKMANVEKRPESKGLTVKRVNTVNS